MTVVTWSGRSDYIIRIARRISLIQMHLYAIVAILVLKLVSMVTPLCPLCTGVSQMNSPIAQTLSQNQTLHGCVAYNWSYGHFFVFWPILAKIWLPWQRLLDPCNQKCLLWIAEPRKPPAISNNILVIYRRNVFVCIYSNFSPKNCCYGNAPFFPCVRECHRWIPWWHKPYLETKLCIDMSLTTEVMAILWFFGLFWPKFGCRGNVP